MIIWYRKDGKPYWNPTPEYALESGQINPEWLAMMKEVEDDLRNKDYKVIKQESVNPGKHNEYFVSTVWLGLDHNMTGIGDPLIFETIIFDGSGHSVHLERYSTLEKAKKGHDTAVETFTKVLH